MIGHEGERTGEFRRGWRVVVAAAFGVGVGIIGAPVFSLAAFVVPLSHHFGWTRAAVSAASLCLVTGTIATAPFVGRAADRLGVRPLGLVSLLALGLATLAMTQVTANVHTFYAGLVLLSFAGCGTSPTIWTRGVATWFDAQRGLALGLTLAGTGLAAIVMPPFLGGLIARHDWRAGYVGLGLVTLAAIVPVYCYFFEAGRAGRGATRAATVQAGLGTREALGTRRFWQLGLANMVVTGLVAALVVHLPALLGDAGMARATALRASGVLGVAVVLGRFGMGFCLDRLHAPYVAAAFLVMPCAGCALLAAAPQSLPLAFIAAFAIGLAAGSEVDLLAYLTSRYFGLRCYGEIYGWQFILFELGVGFGPLLAGRAYDLQGSYHVALEVGAAAFALCAVALGTLGRSPGFGTTALAAPASASA